MSVIGGGVQKDGRAAGAKGKQQNQNCGGVRGGWSDGSKLNSQAVPTRIGLFFYSHHLNLLRKNLKSS